MAESFETDIVIVGAGTAGLVLAHELSRDASLRVHIFEAGSDCYGHPDLQNVMSYTANLGSERDWHFESVPQAGFNGRSATQNSGKLLGGSSSINGGYYAAPSRAGVTAWERLGNPSWSYEAVERACLETIQIHPPDQELCRKVGIDDYSNVSKESRGTGPVQVSTGLENHPVTKAYFRALQDMGYPTTAAIFNDHSVVGQPLYFTQDPTNAIRSDANDAFGRAIRQRSNVVMSLETTVKRVILEGTAPAISAKGVEVVTSSGEVRSYFASKEVIISAGSLSTPKLLELSGIGRSELLRKHGIPVVVEHPFVGERLRNHIMSAVHCELSGDVPPAGPGLKAMAYLPSQDQPGLVEALKSYNSRPTDDVIYDREVKRIFLDPKEGSCYHFMGYFGVPNAWTFGVISAIPFSQGRSHIASSDYKDKPTVDPAFLSHPLDLEVLSRHLVTASNFVSQPALKPLFKMNASGRAAGQTTFSASNLDQVREYLRQGSMTTYHSCGTASMRPKEDGGVVDQQFKVYGTLNLRVVDASVVPVIAHGNPMAVVYGIAKRAAGWIREAASVR